MWESFRDDRRRLQLLISDSETRLAAIKRELAKVDQQLTWSREVAPRELPVKLAKAETGLAAVSNVVLLELRKRQGNRVWVQVDRGDLFLTNRQAIFTGRKSVKFPYRRISSEHAAPDGLLILLTTRRTSHKLGGPIDKIAALLVACRAVGEGGDPSGPFLSTKSALAAEAARHEKDMDVARSERSALVAPPRPLSPGWLPASALFLFLMVGNAMAGPSQPATPISAATTTTLEVEATTTTPIAGTTATSRAGTTTSSTIANEDLIFAPPTAGLSGDPDAPLVAGAEVVTIASITDGDTLRVAFENGTIEALRLIGINSPESGECWSAESERALAALVPVGSEVGITADVSDTDQFDRILRYMWIGTFSINEEMVRRGGAISRRYAPDTALADRLATAQDEAKGNELGLWALDACGPPADADLTIVDISYDAPGDDNVNLNEEWVQIRNDGANLVDLTGWGVKDESASHRYEFPVGFALAAGESVLIHSGCGEDFGTSLFWCNTGSAIWNNEGDTAFLTDPFGNTHTSKTYVPATTTTQAPATTTTLAPTTTQGGSDCHPSYTGQCVPVGVSDVDCIGGTGDGPYYTGTVTVIGPDVYGLDHDDDGIGCEDS